MNSLENVCVLCKGPAGKINYLGGSGFNIVYSVCEKPCSDDLLRLEMFWLRKSGVNPDLNPMVAMLVKQRDDSNAKVEELQKGLEKLKRKVRSAIGDLEDPSDNCFHDSW